ncbi:hypothetical protein ACFX2G_047700 [Malus domestica]
MLLKLLELLDSTQTPFAGLVDCAGKGKLDFEGNQHVVSTCFKADVAASLEVQQQWKTSVDEAEKAWRLFDIWDRHFDKLPVISAKLSLRVTSVDKSGKEDWPMVSKQAQLLRKLAPL